MWAQSQHSGNALLLLLAVADFADDNGVAWPGHDRLAEKTRVSRRHIIRLVDETTATGELWAMNRPKQRSNIYIVTPGLSLDSLVQGVERAKDLGVNSTRGSDRLSIPPQVLVVVTGCPYSEAEKWVHRDIMSLHRDFYVPTVGTPVSPDPSLSVINREVEDQWKSILDGLRLRLTDATVTQWFAGAQIVKVDNGTWTVQLRSEYGLDWVEHRLRKAVDETVAMHAPGIELEFVAP